MEVQSQWLNSYKCLGYICLLCSSMPPWCNSRNILFGHVLVRLRGELLVGQVWPRVLRFILAQTDCQGFALELSAWKLQRDLSDCPKIANGLLGDCLRIAFGLQTTCLCIARGLSWDCPETTLGLPRCW